MKEEVPGFTFSCRWKSLPPAREDDVSWNIAFRVSPSEGYSFQMPTEADLTLNTSRSVVFEAPGEYSITGHSAVWCPPGVRTNTVVITVKD